MFKCYSISQLWQCVYDLLYTLTTSHFGVILINEQWIVEKRWWTTQKEIANHSSTSKRCYQCAKLRKVLTKANDWSLRNGRRGSRWTNWPLKKFTLSPALSCVRNNCSQYILLLMAFIKMLWMLHFCTMANHHIQSWNIETKVWH